MHRPGDRVRGVALLAVLAAALALAGCGRKGMLDPPPTAGLTNPTSPTQRPSLGQEGDSVAPSLAPETSSSQSAAANPSSTAAAPPPPKKTFFLDFLVDK